MTHEPLIPPSVRLLFDAVCDGLATTEQLGELETVLANDEAIRSLYLDYCSLHVDLHFVIGGQESQKNIEANVRADSAVTPVVATSAPVNLLATTLRPTVGYFPSGWPMAYLLATVIFAVGLAIGALTHVSQSDQYAGPSRSVPTRDPNAPVPNPSSLVARITGMVDCVWEETGGWVQGSGAANQKSEIINHKSAVRLGDTLALRSGLLEITYNTGARVILQGPVTYEINSPAGGYLSIGRLTARLDKKSEISGERSDPENQKSEITNHQFAVRTPTAIVTDLGTEFGVEVSPEVGTRVCVLQGRVALQSSAAGSAERVVLERGQSSQMDARGKAVRSSDRETASFAKTFVRKLPDKTGPAFVSLTDLVAGGDGFGDRFFWGINPEDASVIPTPAPDIRFFHSNGKYQRYSGRPQIDGVFIPDGSAGLVQVDSAGHTFDLPKTCGRTCDFGIWSYKGQLWEAPPRTKPLNRQDAKASSMLLLHANAGITFDLSAIRTSARGHNAARFQSVVHNCQWNPEGPVDYVADVWVLVDGQVRFSRMKFRRSDGPAEIDIPLKPTDRFLTLISTDGGDAIACDNPVFLNPRILLDAGMREGEARPDRTK
jgi:hypothetical protein